MGWEPCQLSRALWSAGAKGNLQHPRIKSEPTSYDPGRTYVVIRHLCVYVYRDMTITQSSRSHVRLNCARQVLSVHSLGPNTIRSKHTVRDPRRNHLAISVRTVCSSVEIQMKQTVRVFHMQSFAGP